MSALAFTTVAFFVTFFFMAISVSSEASNQEMLAAMAGHAAVLIVFVHQVPTVNS